MRKLLACVITAIAAIAFPPVSGIAAPQKVACSLLTTAQVTAALGGPVSAGKPMTKEACQWSQPGKGDDLLKTDVTLMTIERFNRFKTATNATVTAVSGLGDDAYYWTRPADAMRITLCVRKGESAVFINVYGGKKPLAEYQSKEKAMAEALLSAL
jgi:hypothetical protein